MSSCPHFIHVVRQFNRSTIKALPDYLLGSHGSVAHVVLDRLGPSGTIAAARWSSRRPHRWTTPSVWSQTLPASSQVRTAVACAALTGVRRVPRSLTGRHRPPNSAAWRAIETEEGTPLCVDPFAAQLAGTHALKVARSMAQVRG